MKPARLKIFDSAPHSSAGHELKKHCACILTSRILVWLARRVAGGLDDIATDRLKEEL